MPNKMPQVFTFYNVTVLTTNRYVNIRVVHHLPTTLLSS